MRILFIAHYFQPEPGFFFGLPFASELARRGHEVEVITGFPNYPGGRIFDGYRAKAFMREEMDGVPVTRLPVYPSHDRSASRRVLSYLSLAATQTVIGPLVAKRADVAYVCQGPATIGIPATAFKWLRRVPFVFNIQDIWPDSLASTGMFESATGLSLIDRFCRFIYARAGRVVVISPGMKTRLVERGVPADKVDVVYNWCNEDSIPSGEVDARIRDEFGMAGTFNILYAGNLGAAQELTAVLQAAAFVQEELPDVKFLLVGNGVEADRLKAMATSMGLTNVRFHPRQTVEKIGQVMKAADVLLVHLKKDPLFEITVPSKTQAYLAAGRPILMGVGGDAAEIVRRADGGIPCEPGDAASIADAVRRMRAASPSRLAAMGRNAAEFYWRELSFTVAVDRYEQIMRAIARPDAETSVRTRGRSGRKVDHG